MSFDFSTLVTDRTQADVNRVKQIAEKIKNGTASESELAEFNSAAMKGAYNYTDLNRVTAAMEALKAKLEGYGYSVPGYQRIEVPHPVTGGGSRLPEGYTELSWIESTGTQYIDTGFKPNQDTRVVMDFNNSGDYSGMTTSLCPLLGARNASSTSVFALWIGTKSYPQYGNVAYNKNGNFTTDINRRLTYDFNKNVVSIGEDSISCASATFATNYDLCILTINNYGNIEGRRASGKLYSCQIYDDDFLVRDYIPCINPSGEVGLYDLVTKVFFGNSGTGVFIAGTPVVVLPEGYTQVEYITSSGTQYIDTDFMPNQDTKVVMNIESTTTADHVLFSARTSASSNVLEMIWSSSSGCYRFYYNNGNTNLDGISVTPTTRRTIMTDKNVATVDGYSVTRTYAAFQAECNMVLLARNTLGTISAHTSGKLYSCFVYDNGSLIRFYIPCINAVGEAGLYDLVGDTFYGNAGTGTFTTGNAVETTATATTTEESDLDPYLWYEFDEPTPETMVIYLLNVSIIRSVLAVMASTPEVPDGMVGLMVKEANDIEVILLDVYRQINIMATTFIPCGEALCGGDNL